LVEFQVSNGYINDYFILYRRIEYTHLLFGFTLC
jgi:hypothetical protein